MIPGDPNVGIVETVAAALGELCDELVLVGGCSASLLIEAPTAPPPRVTYDVDLVASVAALRDYHALEKRFAARGLQRDIAPDAPICRWKVGEIKVDLMPTDERILGFSNRWYPEVVATALRLTLPSGRQVNLVSAPAFLASKFEAFRDRGGGDLALSHDFEDIVNVVEGRPSVVDETAAGPAALRQYVASQFAQVLADPQFTNLLPGLVAFDRLHAERVAAVQQRIAALAALATLDRP